MSQKYLTTTTNPFDCIQQIQQQDEKKLLKKLVKSRKDLVSQRPRDPIISQLYVGFEQQSMKTKRVKTEGNLEKKLFKIGFSSRYKALTKEIYEPNESSCFGQLSKTSEKKYFSRSHNVSGNITQMKLMRPIYQEEIKNEKNNDTKNKSIRQQQIKQKLMNVVQKVYKEYECHKNQQKQIQKVPKIDKNALAKKIKLERLKKQNLTLNYDKQWLQINILKLETFFVKLIKNKTLQEGFFRELPSKDQYIQEIIHIPKKQKVPDYIRQYKVKNIQIDIEQLIKSQNFKILIDEQSVYFGQVKQEKRTGQGVYICSKYKFQGFWADDAKKKGYEISPQGYYVGSYKKNLRHGQGEYFWKNGQKYEGEWRNGFKQGSGVWKSGKGDSYIGQWINGKVQGYGVHITSNGQRYEGYFENFLKQGKGKQSFPNGDYFQGNYKFGKPYGQGKYVWKNQIIYEGQFVEGYRHGKGVIIAKNYVKFIGNFIAEKAHGRGEIFYQNGDYFIGQFKQSQKNGAGSLKLKQKKKIISGMWKNNEIEQEFGLQ